MQGIERMLELRREQLHAGAKPLGWKVGFGAPAGMKLLGTTGPLVGFLTDSTLVAPGAELPLDGWANPMLEPEIALYLDGQGGIVGLGLAIELADLDPPPDDAESIVARNIYHRAVVLGPERVQSVDGAVVRLFRNDEEVASTDDVQALTGEHGMLARLVADTVGEHVRAGDVLIAGSITPALAVRPGDRIRYELDPIGSLELSLSPSASSVSS
jgi:2-keto-4-pentenoate hydratase